MNFHAAKSEHVRYLAVGEGGVDSLLACIAIETPSVIGVYWRGFVELDKLLSAFVQNSPNLVGQYSCITFGKDGPIKHGPKSNFTQFREILPDNADFIRLEHTSSIDQNGEADFAIWANFIKDSSDSQYIGVNASVVYLKRIAQHIANFISETHVANLSPPTARGNLRTLLSHANAEPA